MEKYLPVLRRCSLFQQIGDGDLLTMLSCLEARVISFGKKYTIFTEGSAAKYIGVLLSGSAQISRNDYFGNRYILTEVAPGDVFGEAFACAEAQELPVAVTAAEPCEVMLIGCSHILHTCANHCRFHQQLILNLLQGLAKNTLRLHERQEILSRRSTREKLMAYLMLQAGKQGSRRFRIPFDRQALADYLEVDRSGLSVQIGMLCREGIIRCRKNEFELLQYREEGSGAGWSL